MGINRHGIFTLFGAHYANLDHMAVKATFFDMGGTLVKMGPDYEYVPIEGAQELVQFLRERKAQDHLYTGIITDGGKELTQQLLEDFGWDDVFDIVVARTDAPLRSPEYRIKPMASMMEAAIAGYAEKFPDKKPPLDREIVHVGDSDVDQELANNTGTNFLGVGDKFHKPLEPNQQCESLAQVQRRLEIMARRGTEIS